MGDDDMIIDDGSVVVPLNKELEKQISNAIDPRFLLQLVCLCLFDIYTPTRIFLCGCD